MNSFYNREKRITIQFDTITREFVFMALSAKDKERMLAEAHKNHASAVRQFAEAANSIKTVYLLQDSERLAEIILNAERDRYVAQATLSVAGDEADYRKKIAAKAKLLMNARREELLGFTKEQLTDKLVGLEIDRQFHNAWFCAVLEATLALTLHDENRQRLFASADEMKASVPHEVLEKLYEALVVFLEEGANAQVFLKPHTSKS